VQVGLQLPWYSFPGWPGTIAGTLRRLAVSAEEAGFASLWVMDHLYQLPEDTGWGGANEPMLEAYTTLGALSQVTSGMRIGAMVGGVHLRAPGLLVKAVTTLDVLSGGRAYLGLGAGWYAREATGLGLGWPSRRERFRMLEDTLRFVHHAWSGDRSRFRSETVDAEEPIVVPPPIARPRPPILIGGGGERRTLRLVAEYGDACNILVPDPGESRAKLEVLRRHCDDVGRDYASIEKTSLVEADLRPGRHSADDVIAAIRAQADEGIEHVIVNMPDVHEPRYLETFRDRIIPAVREMHAAPGPS
jgi:F420-dependent oxidoreductase-like protein